MYNCGHLFHKKCLFQWLSRSRSCPQCRAACSQLHVHRIYLNFAERTEFDEVGEVEPLRRIQWVPIDLRDPLASVDLEGAVQCGTDHEGNHTYVARVYFREDLLPANYVPHKKAVFAPYGCQSHFLNREVDLLVLTDCDIKWEQASHGVVPPNALKTGYAESGEELYTGRAQHGSRLLLGKVHPSHHVLYMPLAGSEVSSRHYEVLVVTPKEQAER